MVVQCIMNSIYTLCIGLSSLIYASSATDLSATCTIQANSGVAPVQGTVRLTQPAAGGQTTIRVYLTGFNSSYPSGTKHGFHVHTNGAIGNSCTDAGAHFNPSNVVHGAPTDSVRHVGDLGNVAVDSSGVVNVTITDKMVSLSGNISVVGKSFVVHELEDDLGLGGSPLSNTTGNAGKRYGCCVIMLDSASGSTTTFQTETAFLLLLALISSIIRL